eukprot:gb/GECG01007128.1/.p1 GENE.gb/GECG01007128.1/~~gb/GECG01007128.1/.p1  ORF type:complete len:1179 (+),score=206.79 gb/GECG01007128.1/:1-3537(+)
MALSKRPGEVPTQNDTCGLPPLRGELKKLSKIGKWQKRYFKAIDGYLCYHNSPSSSKVLASIDLTHVAKVELVDMCGWFYLEFDSGKSYNLKSRSYEEAEKWIEQLQSRVEWAKKNEELTKRCYEAVAQSLDDENQDATSDRHSFDTRDSVTASDEGGSQIQKKDSCAEELRGGGSARPIHEEYDSDEDTVPSRRNSEQERNSENGEIAHRKGSNGVRVDSTNPFRKGGELPSEGWVQKCTNSGLKRWEHRYLRLTRHSLLFCRDDKENKTTDLVSLDKLETVVAREAPKELELRVNGNPNDHHHSVRCRFQSTLLRDGWVSSLAKAIKEKRRFDEAVQQYKHSSMADSDESDGDSDDYLDWYKEYKKNKRLSVGERTEKLLKPYLDDVFKGLQDVEEADEATISELYENARSVSFRLRGRLQHCKQTGDTSTAAEHVQTFDKRILYEIRNLADQNNMQKYSSKMLLKFIQCIEVYRSRREIIASFDFDPEVLYPWKEIAFLSRELADRYMNMIAPKMETYTLSSVQQFNDQPLHELLWTPYAPASNLVLTIVPRDFFSALNQHLGSIRQCESLELRGKALCHVVEEIERYAFQAAKNVYSIWRKKGSIDADLKDLALGVINDMGTLLDHLEQVEHELKDIVTKCGFEDLNDNAMLNQDESEMLETKERIPQVIEDIKGHGKSLLDIQVDLVKSDLSKTIDTANNEVFNCDENEIGIWTESMGNIRATACDYLDEYYELLEPYFFEILAGMVIEEIQVAFLACVLGVHLKTRRVRKKHFKFSEELKEEFSAETDAIEDFAHRYMSRTNRHLILSAIEHVIKACTVDCDELGPLGDVGLTLCQSYPTGYASLFSRMTSLRSDLQEYQRFNMTLDVQKEALQKTNEDQPEIPQESRNNDPKEWKCENCFCNTIWRLFPLDSPLVKDLISKKKAILKTQFCSSPPKNGESDKKSKSFFKLFSKKKKETGSAASTHASQSNDREVRSEAKHPSPKGNRQNSASRRSVQATNLSSFLGGSLEEQQTASFSSILRGHNAGGQSATIQEYGDEDFPVPPSMDDDTLPSIPHMEDDGSAQFISAMASHSSSDIANNTDGREKPPALGSVKSRSERKISSEEEKDPFAMQLDNTHAFASSRKGRRRKADDDEDEDLSATLPPTSTPVRANDKKKSGGISKSVRNLFH